jgi:cardiolipin synthase
MDILNNLPLYITPSFIVAYAISILVVIVMIVLENRSPLKTLGWILVLLMLPGLGIVFYIFFGQNFRKEKIIARKGLKNHEQLLSLANAQINGLSEGNILEYDEAHQKQSLVKLLLNNSSALLTNGNKVTILHNGEETFSAIINALSEAKKYIHLEYYIFEEDNIGNQIKQLLIEKAKSGVEVRFIVDDVGSWELKQKFFDELKATGIEVESFLKVRFPWLTSKVNYRNHRKIIVIDGEVGFMGGINIADRYLTGSKEYGIWRDTHMMIEGDAVNSLQTIFLIDWYFVSQTELADPKYFPPKISAGDKVVQIAASGPDSDWPAIMMGFFMAIASAQNYIYIATPYFMPSESVLLAIKAAALGGVDVRIMLPEKSDAFFTLLSTKSYIKELLESGVKIYFYQKGFLHSKTFVSDDILTSIGSANMDFRSFEQNFEVTAFVYDSNISLHMKHAFLNDLDNSYQLDLDEWVKRPMWEKAKESFARLFSPLL